MTADHSQRVIASHYINKIKARLQVTQAVLADMKRGINFSCPW